MSPSWDKGGGHPLCCNTGGERVHNFFYIVNVKPFVQNIIANDLKYSPLMFTIQFFRMMRTVALFRKRLSEN